MSLCKPFFTGGPIFILQLLKESKMHQSKENLTDLFKKKHGNLKVGAIVRNALLLSSSVKQSGLRLIQTLSSFTKEVKTNI